MPVIQKGLMPAARKKILGRKMSEIGRVKTGGGKPPTNVGKPVSKSPVVMSAKKPLGVRAGGTRSARSGTFRKGK